MATKGPVRPKWNGETDLAGGIFGFMFVLIALAAIMVAALFNFDQQSSKPEAPQPVRYVGNAEVVTDPETGAQYLQSEDGITPRVGADGKQLFVKVPNAAQ